VRVLISAFGARSRCSDCYTGVLHTLLTRLLLLGGLLGVELLIATLLLDGEAGAPATGLAAAIRAWSPMAARTGIVFVSLFASFAYLGQRALLESSIAAPISRWCLVAHFASAAVFVFASIEVYRGAASQLPAAAWILSAVSMAPLAAAAFAPWKEWGAFARGAGKLWVHAAFGTVLATGGVALFQSAWRPASRLTFTLVEAILRPIYESNFNSHAETFRIGTNRFGVIISE